MMAVAFSVLLMTGVYGFYNASSQSYSAGISGQALQDGANIILVKLLKEKRIQRDVYRLSTAVFYMIPNGNANQSVYSRLPRQPLQSSNAERTLLLPGTPLTLQTQRPDGII